MSTYEDTSGMLPPFREVGRRVAELGGTITVDAHGKDPRRPFELSWTVAGGGRMILAAREARFVISGYMEIAEGAQEDVA